MKRVTADLIIQRLISEFGFRDLNKYNIYEYIGWAIREIGYGLGEEVIYKQMPVSFYKIAYPCNMIMYLNTFYKGKLLYRTDCKDCINPDSFGYLNNEILTKVTKLTNKELDDRLHNIDSIDDKDRLISDIIDSFSAIDNEIKIRIDYSNWAIPKENIIETSLEEGNVYIQYTAFALDENEVPYIYDEVFYINAILYYCAFILIQSGYIHPILSYQEVKREKELAIQRARNYEKRLTSEQKLDFINKWSNYNPFLSFKPNTDLNAINNYVK